MEWIVTDVDNLLGTANDAKAFLTIWDDALQKTSSNGGIPHMILGSRKPLTSHGTTPMANILNKFFDKASTMNIADAWAVC